MAEYCYFCMAKSEGGRYCAHCGKELPTAPARPNQLYPGTVLQGRYLVGRALGSGGFGITYIGLDQRMRRKLAIKEFFPSSCASRVAEGQAEVVLTNDGSYFATKGRAGFLKEAQILAAIPKTDGVVEVYDFFEENNTVYIVMEYLDGVTLKEVLNKSRFSADRLFTLFRPVVQSLALVHQEKLIHRDISPDNLILRRNGHLTLLDFGAARSISADRDHSMTLMVKRGFAPEEQYRSRGNIGPWTDVYALCATMYKCITGIDPEEAIERFVSDELRWPSALGIPISPQQEAILQKGMSVRAEHRYQSMTELLAAFDALEQSTARPVAASFQAPTVRKPTPARSDTPTITTPEQLQEKRARELQQSGVVRLDVEMFPRDARSMELPSKQNTRGAQTAGNRTAPSPQPDPSADRTAGLQPEIPLHRFSDSLKQTCAAVRDRCRQLTQNEALREQLAQVNWRIAGITAGSIVGVFIVICLVSNAFSNISTITVSAPPQSSYTAALPQAAASAAPWGAQDPQEEENAKAAAYSVALEQLNNGLYDEAYQAFSDLGSYLDSETQAAKARYSLAMSLYDDHQFTDAAVIFRNLEGYEDSEQMETECYYRQAVHLFVSNEFIDASNLFRSLDDYRDSETMVSACTYMEAMSLHLSGKEATARAKFNTLGDFSPAMLSEEVRPADYLEEEYPDAATMVLECDYQLAMENYYAGDLIEARRGMLQLSGYGDAATVADTITEEIYESAVAVYKRAVASKKEGGSDQDAYDAATLQFDEISGYAYTAEYQILLDSFYRMGDDYENYKLLVDRVQYENARYLLLTDDYPYYEYFLKGNWQTADGAYHIEFRENEQSSLHSSYNLPNQQTGEYYYLTDGIYYVGDTYDSSKREFKFTIVDKSTMDCYCYADGNTYRLYWKG